MVRRSRVIAGMVLLLSSWCGREEAALVPELLTGLKSAASLFRPAEDTVEKLRETKDFSLQKIQRMETGQSVQSHAHKLTMRILWGDSIWQIVGPILRRRAPLKNILLPFNDPRLHDALSGTEFEKMMVEVLSSNSRGTSALFAEPAVGKSTACGLAMQKSEASQSRFTVLLRGEFKETVTSFFRTPSLAEARKVAQFFFHELKAKGIRLQLIIDNAFNLDLEDREFDLTELSRCAYDYGHHLIVICQSRQVADEIDALNGPRTRIAAAQKSRCAQDFRWSEELAKAFLNETVMSELERKGYGRERYEDLMQEWLSGTQHRDQYRGWSPSVMTNYITGDYKLGQAPPQTGTWFSSSVSSGSFYVKFIRFIRSKSR